MKASVIIAALLAAAPVFAALQDSHQPQAARHRHMPKNVIKAHPHGRRAASKKAHCDAKNQAALSSSSAVAAQSTQSIASTQSVVSTQSTASVHSVAAAATKVVQVQKPATTTKPHTTTKAAAPAKQTPKDDGDDDNSGGGGSSGGHQFNGGDGTYYSTGLNACGTTDQDSDFIAAVPYGTWNKYMVDGNSNHNKLCGRMVKAYFNGKSVRVKLTDLCAGCDNPNSLDFSPSAFLKLSEFSVGRFHGLAWDFDD